MDREKPSRRESAHGDHELAVKLRSLDPAQSSPDGLGREVRRLLVGPLKRMGAQPVRDRASEAFGGGSPSRWTTVDHRYLEVIALLFGVDLDWLTGKSNTPAPYSEVPLALTARLPKSEEPIEKLRTAALSRLGALGLIFLLVAVMSCVIVAVTVNMAVTGKWEFWTGLWMIILSALIGANFVGIARLIIQPIRSALSPAQELEDMMQTGLRLHLAEKLYEYLSEKPELASGEIAAVLHGSTPVDEDLIARLCSWQTRNRKELLHDALSTAEWVRRR